MNETIILRVATQLCCWTKWSPRI